MGKKKALAIERELFESLGQHIFGQESLYRVILGKAFLKFEILIFVKLKIFLQKWS